MHKFVAIKTLSKSMAVPELLHYSLLSNKTPDTLVAGELADGTKFILDKSDSMFATWHATLEASLDSPTPIYMEMDAPHNVVKRLVGSSLDQVSAVNDDGSIGLKSKSSALKMNSNPETSSGMLEKLKKSLSDQTQVWVSIDPQSGEVLACEA